MTVSDMINLGLAIASFLLATISIVTVIITLLQNKKMIENSTRPYITVMYETITRPAELCRYIVLKILVKLQLKSRRWNARVIRTKLF